jgi:transcriptional regulator with PAS, ATPase and Fis domain
MGDVSRILRKFAVTDAPILITGESGTGKEVSARAIHAACSRRSGPFMAVNCAALPADLIASELFGYEKGAFTGAGSRKIGQIEHANGGTLFLDEIGDMPIDLQSHLLRFLQEGKIVRVGGRGDAIAVDVRIIAATNVDLNAAMRDGRFREDLFYRLNVLSLHMPPLRDRVGDLEPLAYRFLIESSEQVGRDVHAISSEAMTMLTAHDWPGNVRELKSAIFRAVVMCSSGVVQRDDISLTPSRRRPVAVQAQYQVGRPIPLPRVAAIGRDTLIDSLVRNRQNVTATAHELHVSRVTLYRLLRRFDIMLDRHAAG